MNPIGTMPYFLAAVRSRLRARSPAASSSNLVWLKRASALRTCGSSWIGKRRRPFVSTYAKAALRRCARVFALSCGIRLPRPYPMPLGRAALRKYGDVTHCLEGAFDLLVTADRDIYAQQRLSGRGFAILVLPTNSAGMCSPCATTLP